jgi:predicted amidohydrolase YtcJ
LPSKDPPNSLICMLETPAGSAVADLILARVRLPGAKALCNLHIQAGLVSRITAPGKSAGLTAGVPVVDLDGRWAIPGLWDEHVHLTQWALAAHRIDLSGAGSARAFRVEAAVYPQDLDRAVADGIRTGQLVDGGKGLLRVGPLKVLIDGALNTRTAYCVDPYPHGGRGLLTVGEAELLALLVRARDSGFVPAVHAVGDPANEVALNAFERARVRGRIEHAQFVRAEDFARFGALGVTASVQPAHAVDDRDAAEANWAGRTDRAFPLRSLLAAGAALALGSDAPWHPLSPGWPWPLPPPGPVGTGVLRGIRSRP